jgi:hypothetical protein
MSTQVIQWKARCTRPMLTISDFLATYSLDDDTFGQFIWLTDVPTSGNSPHHLGVSEDGKTLVGGGLLSLLKTQVCFSNTVYSPLYLIHLGRILRTILTLATPIDQPSSTATEQYCLRSPTKSGPSQKGKVQTLHANKDETNLLQRVSYHVHGFSSGNFPWTPGRNRCKLQYRQRIPSRH